MDSSIAHWLLLGGVAVLLVLAIINLALTIAEYRKEGYFSGGNGGWGNTNTGMGAFNTRADS